MISLPVALDTIEVCGYSFRIHSTQTNDTQDKLRNRRYPTLTSLESDFKRLIANAKHYNEKSSEIHNDAEKIRKFITIRMKDINPAYKDPNYQSFPTPLPGEEEPVATSSNDEDEGTVHEQEKQKTQLRLRLGAPSAAKEEGQRRATSTPAVQSIADAGESFEGNSFQQAQEKMVAEMIDLYDDE